MVLSVVLLIISLLVVIKSADYATHYSSKVASTFGLSKYIVGFIIVSCISILPETLISINAAREGVPAFGLGTLYGSNVADLTIVFALVTFVAGRNIHVQKHLIRNRFLHIGVLLLPILLGLNGQYSRLEGTFLIVAGIAFYIYMLHNDEYSSSHVAQRFSFKNLLLLVGSVIALLIGAHLTVHYGILVAHTLRIDPVFIGMFMVGLGTTLPELFFSIRAAKNRHDGLAIGDILGTVIADATIVVGIIALISPFSFPPHLVYVTGVFMVIAMIILFSFMSTERKITRAEAAALVLFYLFFAGTQLATAGDTTWW